MPVSEKFETTLTPQQPLSRRMALQAGAHELVLVVRPTQWMVRVLVFVGDREVGRASVHESIAEADGLVTLRFPFMAHVSGDQTAAVCIVESFHGQTEPGQRLRVVGMKVEPAPASPVRDAAALPGAPCLDFWGWTSLAWEGHGHRFRVGERYIRRRGVIEPWKWGCNFIQSHAYAYLPWHLRMVRFLHDHDFLIDEHGFPPQRRVEKVDGRMQVFRVHVQGSRKIPVSQEHLWPSRYMPQRTLAFVQAWGQGFSNVLRHGWRGCIDGWETEEYAADDQGVLASPRKVIELVRRLWKYNPGVCLGSCNHTAASRREHYVWLHEGYHGPNFVHVAMDAGSSWKCSLPGYDDHVPPAEFAGSRGFQNPDNDLFLGYQADSRTYSYSDIGNLTLPDWLIKQSHDFCRQRALGDDRAPASALFWLNEGARLLPEEIRAYASIACHDAPYAAVAMRLESTGLDGRFRWLADAFEDYLGGDGQALPSRLTLRPREWEPAATLVIQNNHLRLERDACAPGGRLRFDPQGCAHFDLDSLSVILAEDVITPAAMRQRLKVDPGSATREPSKATGWRHTLPLQAGVYQWKAQSPDTLRGTWGLWVNQRLVGLLDASRPGASFCLPEPTLCTLQFKPWRPPGKPAVADAPSPRPGDFSLVCLMAYASDSLHEVAQTDAQIDQPHWEVGGDQPARMPARMGDKGTQLLDWPVSLAPGSYLLAITASPETEAAAAAGAMRVGLDRHRYVTKHFDGLPVHESLRDWLTPRQPPAVYSRLGRFELLPGKRTYVVPLTIHEQGRHVLEFFHPQGSIRLHAMRIHRMPMEHVITLQGGVKAEVAERCVASPEARDACIHAIHNDEPALRITLPATQHSRSLTVLDHSRYARVRRHAAGLTLISNQAHLPDLHVLMHSPKEAGHLSHDSQHVTLHQPAGRQMSLYVALDAGCFKGRDAKAVVTALVAEEKRVTVGGGGQPVRVAHDGAGAVQVVRIVDPSPGPYFVQERGWWRLRGAQPVTDRALDAAYFAKYRQWVARNEKARGVRRVGSPFVHLRHAAPLPPVRPVLGDYLKTYTDGEDALILPYGFIHGLVRPGYGCQYTLALSEIHPKRDADRNDQVTGASCRVRVTRLTAYLFAPRLLFSQPVASATLDGQPWHYFDGALVMLPQAMGTHELSVIFGSPATPWLLRTAARVDETRVVGRTMSIRTSLPPYVRMLPEELPYHAAIRLPRKLGKLEAGAGAQLVRRDGQGLIVSFRPGAFEVTW